ncbi:MAG: tRNA preQ1(34) S-adenosylmethionine ribosyltransferase-isomerase QueA [Oscillospiraceae bacterium]|jgi:S-adenosylmethionine:tRNA ribosyltransferase-isomerase|nr:tRNA preQ1(34) S-adenosylmethionine ribosyltransferase-isomerase QueA [Oscillospiraceae bacterium]
MLLTKDFSYELPPELIAQSPAEPRDSSRLLVAPINGGEIIHDRFEQITEYLHPNDLLVLNDSKVFPARLYGVKDGSGIPVEVLLLEEKADFLWEAAVKPGRRLKAGAVVRFDDDFSCEVVETTDGGNKLLKFTTNGNFFDVLSRVGHTPLPHYITATYGEEFLRERYNTVYADKTGSAAAPTAGLHFTDSIFEKLSALGVNKAFVTLHVGLGTFRPVKAEVITDHVMHTERYFMPKETQSAIERCKANGGRVIAVGTTACRTLESSRGVAGGGVTDIFIYPGYNFKVIDGLITNFHLPESTLIMLVSALLGRERTLDAYAEAVKERYRFFSFGDAMFIA